MNKLIILGENGMLGNYIKKYFRTHTKLELVCINRKMFDAFTDDIEKLENILKEHLNSNTLVFNAIGVIPQASKDYQITNEHYTKVNAEFPHKLSSLCQRYSAKLIHATTDCVYTGATGSYIETDPHDETSMYGKSKSLGEPLNCTVIRTSIIGEELFTTRSLVEWTKSNNCKEINGYINHIWNGITCLQYAKIIEYMINNNIFWQGTRHIYSPRSVSKYELVSMINDTFKLNIKINQQETPNKADKSLSSIYGENALFKISDLKQQISEMREFSNTLYDTIIPKVFYAYWDGSPLSYLQYLTVVTFQEHNPDWKVVLYMPTKRFEHKTWHSDEQKTKYTGKDYLENLYKLNIEIRKIDFEMIGFKNDIPEVLKSDYIRYWLLGNYGGLWSDMDVIYINPVNKLFDESLQTFGEIDKIDTVVCYFQNHYPIGLLMSKRNNPYYLQLANNALKYLNIQSYQSIGCHLLKTLFCEPRRIKEKYPELNVFVMSNKSYLPYAWNQINEIFINNIPNWILPFTIGIHWFNGSSASVHYENLIDTSEFPTTGSIYPYIQKYFETPSKYLV